MLDSVCLACRIRHRLFLAGPSSLLRGRGLLAFFLVGLASELFFQGKIALLAILGLLALEEYDELPFMLCAKL